jgi:hypothetical protein
MTGNMDMQSTSPVADDPPAGRARPRVEEFDGLQTWREAHVRRISDPHPIQWACLGLIALIMVLTVGEAIWWHRAASSYPAFLISQPPSGANDLQALRETCGDPVQTVAMPDSRTLIRCGTWWPGRSVWRVPQANAMPTRSDR